MVVETIIVVGGSLLIAFWKHLPPVLNELIYKRLLGQAALVRAQRGEPEPPQPVEPIEPPSRRSWLSSLFRRP